MKKVLAVLFFTLPLLAQNPTTTPASLSRALADALYAKLAGGSTIAGTTTFSSITITGTCTGCTTGAVPSTRLVSTTSPLGGGGDLSADRTLTCTLCLVSGGALGTPSSGTGTNITGIPESGVTNLTTDLAGKQASGNYITALTGNVTASGPGSVAATIAAGAVTLAMQANMATSSLFYRKTAGSGAPEVNTLATLKTDLGLTGTNSGDQTITLTGDATGSGTGSFAATVVRLNGVSLAGLATGILKNTTGTGAPSIAVAGDFPTLNQNTTGNATTASDGVTSASGTAPLTLSLSAKAITGSIAVTPTNPGGAIALQASSPGTAQTGNINVSGIIHAGGNLAVDAGNYFDFNSAATGASRYGMNAAASAANFYAGSDTARMTITAATGLVTALNGLKVTGLLSTGGTTPAVSNTTANSCGTTAATIVGNDNTGMITVGATAGTNCTITFVAAAPTRRQCTVTNETSANLSRSTYLTTTTSTVEGTFVAGDNISYVCMVY